MSGSTEDQEEAQRPFGYWLWCCRLIEYWAESFSIERKRPEEVDAGSLHYIQCLLLRACQPFPTLNQLVGQKVNDKVRNGIKTTSASP